VERQKLESWWRRRKTAQELAFRAKIVFAVRGRIDQIMASHPRFHLHFTPTSSYWLNLVELWFGELTNRKLRRSTHRSVTELETDADTWIQAWNNDPKRVTKTADEVLDSLANCCKQLNALTNNSVH
jgi:transposase